MDETLTLLRYRLGWQLAHTFGEEIRGGLWVQLVRIRPADEEAAGTAGDCECLSRMDTLLFAWLPVTCSP